MNTNVDGVSVQTSVIMILIANYYFDGVSNF